MIFKIITKTMANRKKRILPNIIYLTQSAFISGRLITVNSLIAFETFHYLKEPKRVRKDFYVLKLDMRKAYDKVEWSFLRKMIKKRVSYTILRTLLYVVFLLSLTQLWFMGLFLLTSILLGASDKESFCLLIFFLICVEGLSTMIKMAEASCDLHRVKIYRRASFVSPLFFCDDSVLFWRVSVWECETIKHILHIYKNASR